MAEENSNVLTNHYDKKKIIQFFAIFQNMKKIF